MAPRPIDEIQYQIVIASMTKIPHFLASLLPAQPSKESRPKGPGFGLPPGRRLSMTLLCSTYKLLLAEPIISDLAQRTRISKFDLN
jgi:hypothetical protein